MMKHLAKAKGWLTGFLGKYTTSAPSTVIDEILQLYSTYTKKAVEEFTQVEMQMSTGNMDRLEMFLSKFLSKYMNTGIYRMRTINGHFLTFNPNMRLNLMLC